MLLLRSILFFGDTVDSRTLKKKFLQVKIIFFYLTQENDNCEVHNNKVIKTNQAFTKKYLKFCKF